jgi:hypothetical protein
MLRVAIFAIIAIVGWQLRPHCVATEDSKVANSKPLVVWTGADSHVDQAGFARADSAEAWKKLWLRHSGKSEQEAFYSAPRVEIDFDRCVVIGVFAGRVTNQRGYRVDSVADGDAVAVRIERETFQSLGAVEAKQPFASIVLPRTVKAIVIEENTQGLKDSPPVWTKRAELRPPWAK